MLQRRYSSLPVPDTASIWVALDEMDMSGATVLGRWHSRLEHDEVMQSDLPRRREKDSADLPLLI